MDKYLKRKLKDIGFGVIGTLIVGVVVYIAYLDQTRYSHRLDDFATMNKTILGEITEIKPILSGRQDYEGGRAYFGGYNIEYRFYYKGEAYNDSEFFPNETKFENIIDRCSRLGLYEKVEIRIDSSNPNNSLLNFK